MKVNVYYKTGRKANYKEVVRTETTEDEVILHIKKHISKYAIEPIEIIEQYAETTEDEVIFLIEKHINRYAINQIEVIEQYTYGEEIHTIEGKE